MSEVCANNVAQNIWSPGQKMALYIIPNINTNINESLLKEYDEYNEYDFD